MNMWRRPQIALGRHGSFEPCRWVTQRWLSLVRKIHMKMRSFTPKSLSSTKGMVSFSQVSRHTGFEACKVSSTPTEVNGLTCGASKVPPANQNWIGTSLSRENDVYQFTQSIKKCQINELLSAFSYALLFFSSPIPLLCCNKESGHWTYCFNKNY